MSTQLVLVTSYLNLKIQKDLLNQFNNTIIIRPSVMLLDAALDLFIKPMGHIQSPHLFPTLLLIICSLPNHHVSTVYGIIDTNEFSYFGILTNSSLWTNLAIIILCKVHPTWHAPKFLVRPKRVQLCQKAEVVGTWCRSQLPTLKGGERSVLKAPGLD
jgi:hypothetical protein